MNKKILSHNLSDDEIEALKHADAPAYIATVDKRGFPRITPLWFIWECGSFYLTSIHGKPYIYHLVENPKASICIQVEEVQSGIHRPNRQIKALGIAEVYEDFDSLITRKISEKYLTGEGSEAEIERRCSVARLVVKLMPTKLWGLAGGKEAQNP